MGYCLKTVGHLKDWFPPMRKVANAGDLYTVCDCIL